MDVNITDTELIDKMSSGNEMAFRMLFDRYYTPLSVYADKILNDMDASIDIVQALFVNIYENRKEIKVSNVRSFLYQSVQNRCLNELKHRKVITNYSAQVYTFSSEETNETDELIEVSELEAQLANAINQLPEQCRKIFEMSRFDGISNGEIAERLNISKRTVETQISKALKFLRDKLGAGFIIISILFDL
ncbi:MAG: RNA polymerase sigma-70 factor [Bacteroidales bacterium]|nr:RNA polymerase sigma-70 factor [Bacteroidales bacterium]